MKIKISEELNELIKEHLNVDFNSYEIFYIDDMILGIQYFILRKNFDFLGVRIKNCKILDVYILVPYNFSITKNPSVFSEVKGFPFACANSIRFDPYYSVVDLINSNSHMEIASFSDDSFLCEKRRGLLRALPWNILLVLNSDSYFFTFLFSKLALGPILLMTD